MFILAFLQVILEYCIMFILLMKKQVKGKVYGSYVKNKKGFKIQISLCLDLDLSVCWWLISEYSAFNILPLDKYPTTINLIYVKFPEICHSDSVLSKSNT